MKFFDVGPVGKDRYMKGATAVAESVNEASSKQVHVRMDNLGKDQKKVGDILKKYEKNGSIEFDGETDKGAIFTVKKPTAVSSLNRELKPYYTSAELNELSIDTMKLICCIVCGG